MQIKFSDIHEFYTRFRVNIIVGEVWLLMAATVSPSF